MKDKFLSKAYGGWREASDKLKSLGLPGKWKVITSTLLLLFTLGIGQMWAADVTFTQDKITSSGHTDATSGVTILAASSIETGSQHMYDGSSAKSNFVKIGSSAGTDLSKAKSFIEVSISSGTITSITVYGATNKDDEAGTEAYVCWDGSAAISTTNHIGYGEWTCPHRKGSSSTPNSGAISLASGTKKVRIFRGVTIKDDKNADVALGGLTTPCITSIKVSYAAACTKPGTPGTPSVSTKNHNSATLTWTAAANSDGYKVSIVKKSDASEVLAWTDCATNSYSATGLDPETTYTFKVKAKGASGYCDLGDEASADFATEVDPSATTYKVTLVPAGGTISDATGWTLNAGNYEKEVSNGSNVTLPTFTKANRTFKTWRNGAVDVESPITVTADVTLTAIWTATVENVLYSWESPEGTPIEVGGTATGSVDGLINVEKSGYYCFQINGNTSYDKYVEITLSGEEKVKTGDKIRYTGFYTNTGTKNAAIKMRASSGTAIFTGANLPRIEEASPRTDTYTVPEGINDAAVQITRHQTQTSSFLTKLQIIREVQVEESELLTVTFKFNDGLTPNEVVYVASGHTVAEPAEPTWAHHRFNEWQLGGSAYNFSTAVTSNIALDADWTQLYTISFAAGEGSGDAPAAIADKAQGETFQVPANTYTAPGTKVFAAWNDGANDYAPGDTYTVGTADVVLTAQWVANDYEAKIGTTMYATFAEALTHATDGEIVLLKNVNVTAQIDIAAGVTATIDLAGYKIEYTGTETLTSGVIMVHNGASLTINDSSDPDAGSIVAGTKAYAAIALTKAGDDAANPAILVVNGGTLTGYYYAITGHGARHNTQITINGGTINATASGDNQGIYHPQQGTLTVNGGTITAYCTAIEMRAGTLIINDGTFTATATSFSCNPNGSGTTTIGAAIAIAQHTTKKDISVTINGGTFEGVKAINESNPQVNDPAPQVSMAVTDGNFTGEVSTTDVHEFISGGTFDAPVAAAQCAENYAPKDNGDGTYGVKPLAQSIDLATYAQSHTGTAWQGYLTDNGYAYVVGSESKAEISLDNSNAFDRGLKLKQSTISNISFEVAAGKLITIVTGKVNGLSIAINGAAATAIAGGTDAEHLATSYYYNAAAQNVVITETNTGYNIIREIKIENPYEVSFNPNGGDPVAPQTFYGTALTLPSASKGTDSFKGWYDAATGGNKIGDADDSYIPAGNVELFAQWEAISTDARLASISFSSAAGTLVPAFDPEVVNYTYTMPYGTTDVPQITGATSVNAKAKEPQIVSQASAWNETAVIRGVAESDDTKAYNITMKIAPKDPVCIVKAELAPGSSAASITATSGAYKDDDNIAININKDLKLGGTGAYVKVAVKDTYFQNGDVVEITLASDKNASAWLQIFADEGTTMVAEMTSGVSKEHPNYLTISGVPANATALYLYRTEAADGNMNPYPTSMAVYRAMNPVLKSITFDGTKIDVTSTSVSKTLPYGADLTAVTPEYYWNGAGTAVVTTNEGAWAWGANTYVLTDKDGDATTYTITLTQADHYEAQIGTTGYATLVEAVAAAQEDDVVQLLDNVDLMATGLTIAENITLDLNGFNIKAGEQIDNDILVPAGKKLTLVDNSANAEGKIYTEQAYTGAVTGYGLVRVAGELLMQSGNIYAVIDSDPANLGQFAVVIAAGGKVTVEGGQIKAGWYAISNNGLNSGSTIIVSGGELISTADYAIYNPSANSTVTVSGGVVYGAAGGIAMNRGELTVTGGTITSKDQGTTGTWGDGTGGLSNAAISASGKYESVEVEISGGTIIAEGTAVMITNGTTNPVEVAISGGQFSHVVPAEYCADGFAPVTEPNSDGKYEVTPLGVVHGQAVQDPTTEVYSYTLDNDVVIYASNGDGKLSTSTMTATSSDVVTCGGDEGGYNVNKSAFVLQFPVNVKEFTLYGANSNERTISKVYVNAEASKDIKISTIGRELTGTYSNTKDGKCQTLTAVYAGDNVIAANEYVLVVLSGTVNMYRILYTEAECVDPVITAVNNTVAKEGESGTVSVEATALGATYQWYTCDDELGANPVIIDGATAASYTFTKGTGTEYFKVVVGNNCSAATVSAVAKAEPWAPTSTLVDVTENTVWDWTIVTQDVNGDAIDASNGPKLNTTNGMVIGNYIIGNNFDKVEGNDGAFAIRNAGNKYYQGASLHMHTTVNGILKIHARNDGNAMTLKIQNAGRDINLGALGNWADYTVYVKAGDVVIYNDPETAGKPMRIAKITFTVKETPDYTREVTNNIGTLCVDHNVLAGGFLGATFYQIASRNEQYNDKIDFEEVLPNEELKAGEPYIFKSTTGRIDLYYGTTEADAPVAVRGMVGSFVNTTLDITDENKSNILYIAQNKLWNCEDLVGVGLEVVENRAYIVMSDVPTYAEYQAAQQNSNSAPRRRISIGGNAPAVITGMDELNASEAPVKMIIDGKMYILRGEKMFDATGRLVK